MPDKILPTRTDAIAVRPESIPTPVGKTERRELRTANSKTILHAEKAADGKEIRTCEVRMGAVCYRDDNGELRSIDTTVRDLGDHIGVEWAPYKFRLHEDGIGFDFFSREGGWVGVTLSGIGGEKFDQDTPLTPDITDNTITFRDVRPGCDIVFKCLNQRVKTLRILHDESAPREFVWRFWSDKPELIDNTLTGTDAAGNQLELVATVDGDTITETWTGKTDQGDAVYPVEIDPDVTSAPTASADDGYEQDGVWSFDTIAMYLGAFGLVCSPGIRFTNITVPQGSTITVATLGLYASGTGSGGGTGTIYGRAVDDAGQFGSGANRPSQVAKTTASVAIAADATTGSKSWAITSIIQEIINRVGWSSGNDIGIPIIGSGASPYTEYRTYDFGSNLPSLSITYTAAAGGTAGKPLMLLGCG